MVYPHGSPRYFSIGRRCAQTLTSNRPSNFYHHLPNFSGSGRTQSRNLKSHSKGSTSSRNSSSHTCGACYIKGHIDAPRRTRRGRGTRSTRSRRPRHNFRPSHPLSRSHVGSRHQGYYHLQNADATRAPPQTPRLDAYQKEVAATPHTQVLRSHAH